MADDKSLTCADCQQTFLFTAAEQAFYQDQGFVNEPKRCVPCRRMRRIQRLASQFHGPGTSVFTRQGKPQFEVMCAQCGCKTLLPFWPRPDRPAYCRDCYHCMVPH